MPNVLPFPVRLSCAPRATRTAAGAPSRDTGRAAEHDTGHDTGRASARALRAGWLELLAAACAGLLPGEARIEAMLDRIEALP